MENSSLKSDIKFKVLSIQSRVPFFFSHPGKAEKALRDLVTFYHSKREEASDPEAEFAIACLDVFYEFVDELKAAKFQLSPETDLKVKELKSCKTITFEILLGNLFNNYSFMDRES